MSDLVIRISGDLKDYENALEAASSKSKELEAGLENISKISGVAFAALTAEILVSAKAFGESQLASNKLTQALASQGIYSDELIDSYKQQAKELENLTGVDDDAIVKAQSILQAMIGQTKVTQPLTKAILDLSAAKGMDLDSTTQLIGKGIEGHTGALQKLGITIDEHLSKEERTAKIIELVSNRFGGQAEAANQGLGSIKGLSSAFGDFQEEIGGRFAPVLEFVIKKSTQFFQVLSENKSLMDLIVSFITAGTVVAGVGLTVGVAGLAFLKLQAALEAAQIATTAFGLATKIAMGATGLGLLVIIATEAYLNWSTVWPKLQQVYGIFVDNISDLSGALGKVLSGTFKFDLSMIREGIEEAKDAISQGYDDFENLETVHVENKKTIRNQGRTDEQILEQIHQDTQRQQALDFQSQILNDNQAYQSLDAQQKMVFRADQQSKLREALETEKTIKNTYAAQQVAEDIKARNQYLLDQQKFGTAYAAINAVMHSEIYKGTNKATSELSQLQSSKNNELKTIGKAAAVAQIIMKTAESAMNIYAGFSMIPIVGPALGIVGAIAAIAFGAEQIGNVTAAAQGGLMTGGIPGVDSIPALVQQGELISPASNFEEVIGSVRAQREAENLGGGGFGSGTARVLIGFDGREASQVLTARQIEDSTLGISPEATVA